MSSVQKMVQLVFNIEHITTTLTFRLLRFEHNNASER